MNVKQQTTINNIVSGIAARTDIKAGEPPFITTEENNNVFLMADGWPTIKIGRNGGIDLLGIKSYADPLEAAINGDVYLRKQEDRAVRAAAVAVTVQTAPVSSAQVDAALEQIRASALEKEVHSGNTPFTVGSNDEPTAPIATQQDVEEAFAGDTDRQDVA